MQLLRFLTFVSLFLSSIVYAQDSSEGIKMWLEEEDGSPSVVAYKVKVANGNLTDNADGTASLADQNSGSGGSNDPTASGWTDAGVRVQLITSTDNVTIGSTTNAGKLFIDGDTDEIQTQIQGNATQTSDVLVVEKSDGTDILTGSVSGIKITGDAQITRNLKIGLNCSNLANSGKLTVGASGQVECQADTDTNDNVWQTNSNIANLKTSTDNITVGSSTAGGKVFVDGDTDEIQVQIQGNATQTANLLVLEKSDGTDILTGSVAGIALTGDLDISRNIRIGGLNCASLGNGGKLVAGANGQLSCQADISGSGSGTPGGSNTQVQFNDSSSFGGDAGMIYDKNNDLLTLTGSTDSNHLVVTGNSGQLSDILVVEKSDGTDILTGSNVGVKVNAPLNIASGQKITADDGIGLKPPVDVTICASAAIGSATCDYVVSGNASDEIMEAIDRITGQSPTGATQGGSAGKGTIHFSPGTYTLDASITNWKPGIVFRGSGMTPSVLKMANNFNGTMFSFTENTTNPSAGVIFERLYFDGNKSNNTSGTAIDTKVGSVALWDLHIINCFFFDFDGTVLVIDDPWGFRFFQSHIEDSESWAIVVTNGASKTNGFSIVDAKIIQTKGGIQLNGITGGRIIASEINSYHPGRCGVDLVNADYAKIEGIDFTAGSCGIRADASSSGTQIIGNNFAGMDGPATQIYTGAVSSIITGNIFSVINQSEIVDNGTNTVQSGNRGDDSGTNTDNSPNALNWNPANASINALFDTAGRESMLALVGASNEVRMGDSTGTDYFTISSSGQWKANDSSTTAGYLIPDNRYAFKSQTAPNAGFYFNAVDSRLDWRDTTALWRWQVDLNGNTIQAGDLTVGDQAILTGSEVRIVNGSNCTMSNSGDICIDTTEGQFLTMSGQVVKVALTDIRGGCPVENITSTDDNIQCGFFRKASTVKFVGCSYVGTGTTPATIQLEDGAGNAVTTQGTVTCTPSSQPIGFAPATSGNTFVAGEVIRFDTTNTPAPDAADDIMVTYIATEDRQ